MSKKAISTIGLIVLTVLSTSIAWMPSAHYEVSDGYAIDFKSKDPSGSFKTMDGSVEFDEANIDATQFNLKIDVKSISTGNGMMNKKSQTAEWFDAVKYPFAKFKSTKVVKKGTELSIVGDLTIKGVTKAVTLTVTGFQAMPHPMMKKPALGANAFTTIKRTEFNAGKYAPYVGDEVRIDIAIEAVAQ